jgi:uncharacterized protein
MVMKDGDVQAASHHHFSSPGTITSTHHQLSPFSAPTGEYMMIVTPLYAGLLALWFVVLGVRVIDQRRRNKVSLGDGGSPQLQRAIRGHANFSEYAPLALLLLAILELSRFPLYVLHGLGATLLVARLLHGCALSFTTHFPFGRVAGAALTFLVLVVAGVLCLYQAFLDHTVRLAG